LTESLAAQVAGPGPVFRPLRFPLPTLPSSCFMRSTLFIVPHDLAGIPLLGFGWGLILLTVVVLLAILTRWRRGGSSVWTLIQEQGWVWVVTAAVLVWVLPRLEVVGPTGEPLGIAVRGYGLFLMLAAVASIGLAAWRSERAGIGAEAILRMYPWTFAGGLIGARLFYVIQYFDDFQRETIGQTLLAMAALTQGGLVVYGGLIGGTIASLWVVRRNGWPAWRLGDAIVPCIFVGLMFGRMGCLMHGCCFGGPAAVNDWWTIRFPPGSPVYQQQLLTGELIGLGAAPAEHAVANLQPGQRNLVVRRVRTGSLGDSAGIAVGDELTLAVQPGSLERADPTRPVEEIRVGLAAVREGRLIGQWAPEELPSSAMPVLATQVISALLALAATLTLLGVEWWLHRRWRPQPGVLMLIGFCLYAVLRIYLEWLRIDEPGQFGTALSISQWVSVLVLGVSVATLVWRLRRSPAAVERTRDAAAAS